MGFIKTLLYVVVLVLGVAIAGAMYPDDKDAAAVVWAGIWTAIVLLKGFLKTSRRSPYESTSIAGEDD